jgi:putative Holliday junction resolvase
MSAPRTLLAFDYGRRRVGVACGNTLLREAQPLRTIAVEGAGRFDHIQRLIKEWQPDALVVGVPFHPDGAEHDITLAARKFARQLNGRYHLPVHEVDERYSSVEAERDDPDDLDSAAAAVILQQYFNDNP